MNNNYWSNPTLSEKLEKLGCESQFDYIWWTYASEKEWELIEFSKYMAAISPPLPTIQKAYHFSDILLPQNAKKIFTLWGYETQRLFDNIKTGHDWQNAVEEEVDKVLQSK